MKSETYKIINAVVEDIITETSNIKTFVLKPDKGLEFKTGQFVELAVKGLGKLRLLLPLIRV